MLKSHWLDLNASVIPGLVAALAAGCLSALLGQSEAACYDRRRCAVRVLVDFRAHPHSGHLLDSHGSAAALGCH